jgi:catechol 2,3-dioxygenase-like lactoylglutathione lyase family enzyme
MFTYVCLGTNDLRRAIRFYDAMLATLGISRFDTSSPEDPQGWAGWGVYEDVPLPAVAGPRSKQTGDRVPRLCKPE